MYDYAHYFYETQTVGLIVT